MISLPSEPKIKNKDEEGKKATFEIESLYPGYGTTIGNSLRRVLLSSLEGTAITQVNMEDVQHEFSTMEGIKEDSLNIILNLKQLNFKVFSDEPQKATLSVSGEKDVKAKDFDFPTQVEVVNGEAPIATLTSDDAELEMEVTIEKGIGFVPAEERKEGKEKVGQITIDAIFTPVKSVNFNVENMRVGERTDFDKLTIDVETDGSIDPEEAFNEACNILVTHFNLLTGSLNDDEVKEKTEPEQETKKEEVEDEKDTKDTDETNLDDLGLSSRVTNILKDADLTVKEIREMDESDLKDLSGIGKKSAESILKAVKDN